MRSWSATDDAATMATYLLRRYNHRFKPPGSGRTQHDDLLARRNRFVVRIARIWHERRFVDEQAPWVIGANLRGAVRDTDDAAFIGKTQLEPALFIRRLFDRVGFANIVIGMVVQALGVGDQLGRLLFRLRLKEHVQASRRHARMGEVSDRQPGKHQVAALDVEDYRLLGVYLQRRPKIRLVGKGPMRRTEARFTPVRVLGLGVVLKPVKWVF